MSLTLTFDLGTTYFKAALFDERGALQALAHRPLEVEHLHPDLWEMGIEVFRHTLSDLAHKLRDTFGPLDRVEAISFATQANSFALLDRQDRPLTPLILWPDGRARNDTPSAETLLAGVAPYGQTGVPTMSCEFSPAKLLWIAREQPDIWRQARRLVFISDYLTLWLSGQHVTEAGVAGLTALVDIRQPAWCPEALARLNVPIEWIPAIARAGTDLGAIRPEAAAELGVPATCRLVLGCLDQYAGAIGAGNVTPGDLSETTGTVLATIQCANRLDPEPNGTIFQGPGFAPDVFFRMVFGDVSANLLERYRNSLPDRPPFEELVEAASRVPAGAEGLRLCDKPHLVPPVEMFVDRQPSHGRGHEVRAILEAVAKALAEQVGQLTGGTTPEIIRSVGGAARSRLWRQIKANTLRCPVVATACAEPTSLGAAILAAATMQGRPVRELAAVWIETLPADVGA
ncbi:MAG: FGGY-family carbohydrate kinase [Pirellulales bacterium]|nr:FGGY-family carbohydrate kinase [Pirellulales bacterium]